MTRFLFWLGLSILSFFGFMIGITAIGLLSLPDVGKIRGCMTTEMFHVSLCPGGPNYTALKQISPHLISAVLISEDAGFYQHHGFDFDEIKDSLNKNLREGTYARGGSTISQQLVKNVFLSADKSIVRKIKEAFLTYELEKTLKKNEILERYLNVVQFGDKLYGIKAAARHYFAKEPSQLNVLESAFLAVLLPSPVKYSQSFKSKKLTPFMRGRVSTVAHKLVLTGRISSNEYQFAKSNLDAFPWHGLGSATASSNDFINSLENTDFTRGDDSIRAEPEEEMDSSSIPIDESFDPESED